MRVMENKYFKLHSSSKVVKGKDKGAIYFLDEQKIEIVPLDLVEFIDLLKVYSIEECRELVDSEKILEEYLAFLKEKRVGFITSNPNVFSDMDDYYETPSHVFISSIAINEDSNYDIQKFINELDFLLCKHIELRVLHSNVTLNQIMSVLKYFEGTTIRSINLHVQNSKYYSISDILLLLRKYQKVSYAVFYSMPFNQKLKEVVFTTKSLTELQMPILVEKDLYINIQYYAEARNFNTFYNKKVSIDEQGNLKNTLSCKTNFGKYCPLENTILKIIKDEEFTKFWRVTPDMIEDIKHSELRYAIYPNLQLKLFWQVLNLQG